MIKYLIALLVILGCLSLSLGSSSNQWIGTWNFVGAFPISSSDSNCCIPNSTILVIKEDDVDPNNEILFNVTTSSDQLCDAYKLNNKTYNISANVTPGYFITQVGQGFWYDNNASIGIEIYEMKCYWLYANNESIHTLNTSYNLSGTWVSVSNEPNSQSDCCYPDEQLNIAQANDIAELTVGFQSSCLNLELSNQVFDLQATTVGGGFYYNATNSTILGFYYPNNNSLQMNVQGCSSYYITPLGSYLLRNSIAMFVVFFSIMLN